MKRITEYNPLDIILGAFGTIALGWILFLVVILLGFGTGVFIAIFPGFNLVELGNAFSASFLRIYITFPASILATLIVPWSFLLKAGYLVSFVIFVGSETEKRSILTVTSAFFFALGDGIICTRFFQ